MSLNEIKEAMEKGKAVFGVRQILKFGRGKGKKKLKVFIAKDAREETIGKLENAKIEFEVLKPKAEMSRTLGLNFESEVFLIR